MRIRYNHEKNGIPPSKVTQSQKSDADSSDEEREQLLKEINNIKEDK